MDLRLVNRLGKMHGLHAGVSPPFSKENQLCDELDAAYDNRSSKVSQITAFLPGQPCIRITDQVRMNDFLTAELWAQDLEMMAHQLWVMTTPSSANINSLHRQKVKGREIVVSEDPRLHLVWIHDRIFIKPIPTYLMSHAFWDVFLSDETSTLKVQGQSIRMAALGYLRTYTYLIRHQSDFLIAQRDSLRLVPQHIDWAQFCHFLSDISKVDDVDVSGRYQYGELRLTRLNFYAKFFLRKFYYQQVHGQYGDYFARLYGPILFTVAMASTILNAMQVELAAEQILDRPSVSLGSLSSWVSRVSMVGTAFASLCFLVLWLWIFLDEWIYTLKRRPWSRKTTRSQAQC